MPKAHECICCQEIPEDSQKLEEIDEWGQWNDRSSCITDTDALRAVCLNKWVLQTAFYQYSAQYNDHYEGPQHKKTGMLHIASLPGGAGLSCLLVLSVVSEHIFLHLEM